MAENEFRYIDPGAELDQLMESNKAGFSELARQGVQLNEAMLLHLRIETLAELVFGSGPGMVQFKLAFERQVSQVLEEARRQARKAQLAAGANVPPEQMKQMARAQGLLGPDGQPARR